MQKIMHTSSHTEKYLQQLISETRQKLLELPVHYPNPTNLNRKIYGNR